MPIMWSSVNPAHVPTLSLSSARACLIQIDDCFEDFTETWRGANEGRTRRFIARAKAQAGRARLNEASLGFVGLALGGIAD